MRKSQTKARGVESEWTDYYVRRGEVVTSAWAHRVERKDKDGFYKFLVIVNVKPHHTYCLEVYEK